jgi:hypothetical protein
MSNSNSTLSTSNLNDFKVRVNTIIGEQQEWQRTVFATANDNLYSMLGKIYDMYTQAMDGSSSDELKQKWLFSEAEKRGLKFNKAATFLQLVTKLVFSNDCSDSRRVSSYIRVLNAAAQSSEVIVGADVAKFIKKYGGIEEIRASLTKNTKTAKQRAQQGRELALSMQNIAVVETDETKEYVTDVKDTFVVMVGVVNATGNIELKHICYEKEIDGVSGKTAVNTALSNLYTKSIKKAKANEAKVAEEESIERGNEVGFDTQLRNDDKVINAAMVA